MLNSQTFHYVYILRDCATGRHHYTGVTQNLQHRLEKPTGLFKVRFPSPPASVFFGEKTTAWQAFRFVKP